MPGKRYLHPANRRRYEGLSTGERMADRLTASFGSWAFILVQSVIVLTWIGLNVVAWRARWDPYPFIALNLVFSTQAAYAAPLLLLSQNRQSERDRIQAEHDFRVNQLALQYLFAWHRDAHGEGCTCVGDVRPAVDAELDRLAAELASPEHS
ncbi:MAG: DUF1003 domain-containing protein [Nocardioidaceae bacterium]